MDRHELGKLKAKAEEGLRCGAEVVGHGYSEEAPVREPHASNIRAYWSALEALLPPHPEREKPLVSLSDGPGEAAPSAGDDLTLRVVEELDDESVTLGAHAVEVEAEPKALLLGPGNQGGKQLAGANVENVGDGHAASEDVQAQLHCATSLTSCATGLTMTDVRRCAARAYDDINLEAQIAREEIEPSDLIAVIDYRAKWKRDAVGLVAMLLEAELKARNNRIE